MNNPIAGSGVLALGISLLLGGCQGCDLGGGHVLAVLKVAPDWEIIVREDTEYEVNLALFYEIHKGGKLVRPPQEFMFVLPEQARSLRFAIIELEDPPAVGVIEVANPDKILIYFDFMRPAN